MARLPIARARLLAECVHHRCVPYFFSSRRRHTRCYRDWSSDVCSSDLDPRIPGEEARVVAAGAEIMKVCAEVGGSISGEHRSEERRVGKECRARWTQAESNSVEGNQDKPHRKEYVMIALRCAACRPTLG